MDRELKRGVLEMLLLRLVEEEERYGYELLSLLEERSDGAFELEGGSLYPVLYRLEEEGFLETRWETPDRGRPRKYYSLTREGAGELERRLEEWAVFRDAVDHLIEAEEGGVE